MVTFENIKIKTQRGFTLLEVLLVVAVIAILAGIVIIAINPGKNLGDARNSQRQADVTTILNGLYQYILDNNGNLPATGGGGAVAIPTAPTAAAEICKTGAGSCSALVDLSALTTAGKYLVALPADPQCPTNCNANGVGYKIQKDANGRITVVANVNIEQGKTISVTR